jgi:uncharacterized UPF0160 family protein
MKCCSLGFYVLKGRLEVIIWLDRKVTIESVLPESTLESKVYTRFVRYKKQKLWRFLSISTETAKTV